MNKSKILEIIDKLTNNAMFSISLTSKELFHTNFWAWMLRKYPQIFTPVFYSKYNNKDKVEVLREYENTDLCLKIGDKSIIIENKLKSVPDIEQLERYSEKIKDSDKKIILVSYYTPLFFQTYEELLNEIQEQTYLQSDRKLLVCDEIISYEFLYKRMNKCLKNKNSEIIKLNDRILIQIYIEFLNLLNLLQKNIIFSQNDKIKELWNIINDNDIQSKLKKINFEKTFERIFLIKLTQEILYRFAYREYLDKVDINCGRDLKVYSDMLFYFKGAWDECESNRQDLCYLGISLWGNYYRRYAGLHKKQCGISNAKNGRYDKDNKEIGYKYLSNKYSWFFKDNDNWGGYSYDKEMYLYQKIDISELTVEELIIMAVNDLELIYQRVKCQD